MSKTCHARMIKVVSMMPKVTALLVGRIEIVGAVRCVRPIALQRPCCAVSLVKGARRSSRRASESNAEFLLRCASGGAWRWQPPPPPCRSCAIARQVMLQQNLVDSRAEASGARGRQARWEKGAAGSRARGRRVSSQMRRRAWR